MEIIKVTLDCFCNKDGLIAVSYEISSNDHDAIYMPLCKNEISRFEYAINVAKKRAASEGYSVYKTLKVELIAD